MAIILAPFPSFSQVLNPEKKLTQYTIDTWSGEELPANGIMAILQTKNGYLWLATFSGLVRFDGLEFKIYDRFNTPAFEGTGFRSLFENEQGQLYVGGNGKGLYLKTGAGFIKYSLPFGKSSNHIKKIYKPKSEDKLFFGTLRGLVTLKDSVYQLITPEFYKDKDFPVYDIEEDKQGNIWIATANGIYQYVNEKLLKTDWKGKNLTGEIFNIEVDKDNHLWICSYDEGVFLLKEGQVIQIPELREIQRPINLFIDSHNALWIGSEQGIGRYYNNKYSKLDASTGLSDNTINSIKEDHEGSIWIGTYYGGLSRLKDGSFTNYSTFDGLDDNTIHCIYQDLKGIIWAGTNSGVSHFKNGSFFSLSNKFPALKNRKIRDIYSDKDQNIWIATYSGLYVIKNDKLFHYDISSGLVDNQVRLIFEAANKDIYIGTRNGISVFSDGKITNSISSIEGLTNTFITSITELDSNSYLIGTTGGLHLLKDEKVSLFHPEHNLLRSTIFHTYKDKEGSIWIGSNQGLYLIKEQEIYSFNNASKLFTSNIFQVIEDNNKTFWLTSDKGIIRISKKELIDFVSGDKRTISPLLFDKSTGLRTNEITAVSKSWKDREGKIWFSTLNGISVIDPQKIILNNIPPPIVVDEIFINGTKQDLTKNIIVPPGNNKVEIHYNGLSYKIPKKVKFKYRLAGFDDDWQEVGDERTAKYTSLPSGDYTFDITACNNDGVWNTQEASISFFVDKAFYETYWFYLLITFCTTLAIFSLIQYRTKSIRRTKKLLERKINERTKEVLMQKEEIEAQRDDIENKNKELENAHLIIEKQNKILQQINENLENKINKRTSELRNAYSELMVAKNELDNFVYKSSHEIKGPLARLQGLSNLALMEVKEEKAKYYFKLLFEESKAANRIIAKLSYTHELKNIQPEITYINIHELINEIITQLENEISLQNIKLDISTKGCVNIYTDVRLLKNIIYNLLENAVIFQSIENPVISIEVERKDNHIILLIGDNGSGIENEILNDIYNMFFKGSQKSRGLGLGLFIVKKAVDLLEGKINIIETSRKGTSIQVILPDLNTENDSKINKNDKEVFN